MKIIIMGGYGIFGGRLCQLLATDSRLSLYIAGRSYDKANAFCETLPHGAQRHAIALDRTQNLHAAIQQIRPDLIIDASGPFQYYRDDAYRLVDACVANDVNYMDLADGSDFVKGIGQFDQRAKEKNLYILSGVSSFPVLTATVVRRLTQDMPEIISIRGGIAPSPFAVVGINVIRAISSYAGKPVKLIRNGKKTFAHALTESVRYTISPPGRLPLYNTRFSLVDVPDLQVLPSFWPALDSIWIGAGTVPEILHRMLNGLAWLVRLRLLPSLKIFAPLFFHVINRLRWGEHRGGMFIEVNGITTSGSELTRSWHLLAEGEDGPYIPCMALEAMLHRILRGKLPAAGARPATSDLELADYEHLFETRSIFTGIRESTLQQTVTHVFRNLLGDVWNDLPKPLQAMHDTRKDFKLSGMASVQCGKGWLARVVAKVLQFPAEGNDIPVEVNVTHAKGHETWTRTFAGRSFSSILSIGKGRDENLLCERFGPLAFAIALVINNGKLHYVVRDWRLWKIPLPRAWIPGGDSYEYASDGRFNFNIEIQHPLTGLIVIYKGWLLPQTAS